MESNVLQSEYRWFELSMEEREQVFDEITTALREREEVSFAYIYGSVLDMPFFRDIDVAVWLAEEAEAEDVPAYARSSDLTTTLEKRISTEVPIEVAVLNDAPYYFRNKVFGTGRLLFARDGNVLADIIEQSSRYVLAERIWKERSHTELMQRYAYI